VLGHLAGPPDSTPVLGVEDLSRTAADILQASSAPALVLHMPSERIVAASPAAAHLLDPDDGVVVGRLLEDFTTDRPALGPDLFAGGHLNGFETARVLRRSGGGDVSVRMWVRTFDHQPSSRLVLVVLIADHRLPLQGPARAAESDAAAVVGTADAALMIERISNDAETLFGRPVSELLAHSLLSLVVQADVSSCLAALSEATATHHGVTLYLDVRPPHADANPTGCEVLILPLQPSPSCAFVFLPTPAGMSREDISADFPAMLLRLVRGTQVAQLARTGISGFTDADVPGLSRLTTRELEIVTRVVDGDRAPAIAAELYLSQSTVRNHLGSVFAKLGVSSQQQLLRLFRPARGASL
jgi:DNA-binding CsgD family transcriptional regulator